VNETARVPLERSLVDARVLRICAWSVALAFAIGFVAQALVGIIGLATIRRGWWPSSRAAIS